MEALRLPVEMLLCLADGVIYLAGSMICGLIEKKDDFRFRTVLYLITYTLLITWITLVIPAGTHVLFTLPSAVMLLMIFFRATILRSLLGMIVPTVYIAVVELAGTVPLLFFYPDAPVNIVQSMNYRIYSAIPIKIISVVFLLFLIHRKQVFRLKSRSFSDHFPLTGIGYLFWLFIVLATFFYAPSTVYSKPVFFVTFIAISFIIFSFFTLIDRRERNRLLEKQAVAQSRQEQMRHVEEVMMLLRQERHEQRNRLATLKAMLQNGTPVSPEVVSRYLSALDTPELDENLRFSTGSSPVDALLSVKCGIAAQKGIMMDVSFEEDVTITGLPDIDLVGILGNLTDNAFDALSQLPEGHRRAVAVQGWTENGKYILEISNNGPAIPGRLLNRVLKERVTTKTQHPEEHGFGLTLVRQIAEARHAGVSVRSDETETVFRLEFEVVN